MEINNAADLRQAIKALEQQKDFQKDMVMEQYGVVRQNLRPINLLKSTFNKVAHAPGIMETILNATVGLGAGVLSKKLLIGKSTSMLKRIFGEALEFGVAGFITKNSGAIKNKGALLINKIFKKLK